MHFLWDIPTTKALGVVVGHSNLPTNAVVSVFFRHFRMPMENIIQYQSNLPTNLLVVSVLFRSRNNDTVRLKIKSTINSVFILDFYFSLFVIFLQNN
jgi:hypothetical protein